MRYSYELWLEELGARIKQLRKARGWTLRDMIVQHGFHVTHWQAFERGKKGISVPSLMRVAELFDMTLCQLLEGLGEIHKSRSKPVRSAAKPAEPTRPAK